MRPACTGTTLVDAARRGQETGGSQRWRDAVVRRMAETIAEQRTLWRAAGPPSAMRFFPSTLTAETRRTATLRAVARRGRRHHGGG